VRQAGSDVLLTQLERPRGMLHWVHAPSPIRLIQDFQLSNDIHGPSYQA